MAELARPLRVMKVDASGSSMRHVAWRIAAKLDRAHFCYEGGPTGYWLYRLMHSLGDDCTMVSPSLIPKRPGDRIQDEPPRCGRFGEAASGRRTCRSLGFG
jgi:hypothetical protein